MTAQTATSIEISADDPPLHYLITRTPAWNYHPRVFLDIADTGEAKRPYCGTVYRLAPSVELKDYH